MTMLIFWEARRRAMARPIPEDPPGSGVSGKSSSYKRNMRLKVG